MGCFVFGFLRNRATWFLPSKSTSQPVPAQTSAFDANAPQTSRHDALAPTRLIFDPSDHGEEASIPVPAAPRIAWHARDTARSRKIEGTPRIPFPSVRMQLSDDATMLVGRTERDARSTMGHPTASVADSVGYPDIAVPPVAVQSPDYDATILVAPRKRGPGNAVP